MSDQRRTSERHVIVGLSRSEYEQRLVFGPPVGGREPRQHRHPDLGVTHAHGSESESRTPHTHSLKQVVDVDSYIPLSSATEQPLEASDD